MSKQGVGSVLGLLLFGFLFVGCAAPPYGSSHERGWAGRHAASGVRTPIWASSYDIVAGVESPLIATSETDRPKKQGSGSCINVLSLVAIGDASIESIAKEAGITTIHHVDVDSISVLFVFSRYQVTVYGN